MSDLGLESFEQALKQLAELLLQCVETELHERQWDHAILDVRYDKEGSSWMSKIRVTMPLKAGFWDKVVAYIQVYELTPEIVSLRVTNEIDDVLSSLNKMRRLFKDEWFGILMKVDSTKKCSTNLNYDSNCSEDLSFFKT